MWLSFEFLDIIFIKVGRDSPFEVVF